MRQAVLRALVSAEEEDGIARLLARASTSGLVLSDQFELGLSMVRSAAAASGPTGSAGPTNETGSVDEEVDEEVGALEDVDGVIERLQSGVRDLPGNQVVVGGVV